MDILPHLTHQNTESHICMHNILPSVFFHPQLACSWAPPRCSFLSRPPLAIRPSREWAHPCHLQPSWVPWWLRVEQPWWGPVRAWWLGWRCLMASWGTRQPPVWWAWRRGWWDHRAVRCLRAWCPLRACTPSSLGSRLSGTWGRYVDPQSCFVRLCDVFTCVAHLSGVTCFSWPHPAVTMLCSTVRCASALLLRVWAEPPAATRWQQKQDFKTGCVSQTHST